MVKLPEIPERIASLPRDERGYPVPWFVAWVDGRPVFPAADPRKLLLAIREGRCWVCGETLGKSFAFVIGPMCCVNRISSEPPSHRECGIFSAMACPFLTKPKMKRMDLSELGTERAAGTMIERNPGVCLVWCTRSYQLMRVENGVLFQVGDPHEIQWFAEGRAATRAEVMESIETGYPLLESAARQESPDAVAELMRMRDRAMELIPREQGVVAQVG